ncbi:MAG TPA: PIN domain-containing protein [Bryobacteraceae bacterium]|nr:PIN domain-containing protein [Bryobacteraceae bacterium]
MTVVFADTFYWIALTLPADMAYEQAQQVTDNVVTTEEVLTEYLTFFCAAPEYLRREVAANVEAMLTDPGVRIIPQSHASFITGFELYRARPDKGYSLVDCISMQTMRREGLTDVLTNDKHFEQEGFRALFRDYS